MRNRSETNARPEAQADPAHRVQDPVVSPKRAEHSADPARRVQALPAAGRGGAQPPRSSPLTRSQHASPQDDPSPPLVLAESVTVSYAAPRGARVRAVECVSLEIARGEIMGLVGESGCGKSTLSRALLGMVPLDSGRIYIGGTEVRSRAGRAERRKLAKRAQMIFQDPFDSLDPRMTVGAIVEEGMIIHGMFDARGRRERAAQLLERVGLSRGHAGRFPHEFSGGQRQRVGIARALAVEPELIICDEAVSALDLSIRAQIMELLLRLRDELGLTLLFISHDLNAVRCMSDRIAVMYLGSIVELAPAEELCAEPQHPYTRALLAAVPSLDPDAPRGAPLAGDPPSPIDRPAGCAFAARCPQASDRCRAARPELREIRAGRYAACELDLI